jgi:hypothetical protein
MLHRICIFSLLIGMTHLAQAQHLQLLENRGEIGIFKGQGSYRGDIAPDHFKFNNIIGGYYKKQYNDYAGFKLNYEQIHLRAIDSLSDNVYAKSRMFFFSRQFHDISLMGEFYFTRFLPGNKAYRFTSYLGIGAGYMLEFGKGEMPNLNVPSSTLGLEYKFTDTVNKSKGYLNFPIQLGFKFNLTRRWNIFGELMYRFVTSDDLDYFSDGRIFQHYNASTPENKFNFQGSRSGKDQFFSVKGGISYNLIKIYGEEKFKPGKRSKLASLKEQEASQEKPGFFSRLKFKRK